MLSEESVRFSEADRPSLENVSGCQIGKAWHQKSSKDLICIKFSRKSLEPSMEIPEIDECLDVFLVLFYVELEMVPHKL